MNQELFGKWYVYRYHHPDFTPVLKAPETTLEISEQAAAGCRARLEIGESTEPVEIEMSAENGGWRSKEDGSFAFLDVRWSRFEHDDGQPGKLMGQVGNKDDILRTLDFFVAVRSRRTHRLPPAPSALHFGGAYSIFSEMGNGSSVIKWRDDGNQGVEVDQEVIRIGSSIYDLDIPPTPYLGGFRISGKKRRKEGATGRDRVALWILPGMEPRRPGRPLAIGFNEYHEDAGESGAVPACQGHLCLC